MWALSPETEGVSCGLGDTVADRMCRDPQLRSLKPADVARMLGVSEQAAQVGILRLASMATGRAVSGVRGLSFDQAIARFGRTSGRHVVEYAPDARGFGGADDAAGGFATPAAPGLMDPGETDPRVRSFTSAILDPNLVQQYGADAVKQLGVQGLVPPPEDLDRVALFAPPPISGDFPVLQWLPQGTNEGPRADGTYRDPTWADVQSAGSAIGRPDLNDEAVRSCLAWWRQAYALGPLPEDEQGIDPPDSASYNWPEHTDNTFRRIYFWGFGKDGRLYQHMQLQKKGFEFFAIFNKWGQNLTYVWNGSQWIAGWDAGDWAWQNKRAIASGLQLAVTAVVACLPFAGAAVAGIAATLFGVTQFGLSIGVMTTISAAVAAQQAFISGMMAIGKGDLGAAFKYLSDMAGDLGSVPITGSAGMIPPQFQDFVQNPAVQALGKVVGAAGTGDPSVLMQKAAAMGGGVILKVGQAELTEARKLVPDHLLPWFDRAVREGGAAAARQVPWYAQGVHTLGMVMGTLENPQTAGVHAPRVIAAPVDDSGYTLAQLQQELADAKANYDRVSQTAYGQSHPAFLAQYQKNIDDLNVRIAVKKNPAVAVQGGGGGTVTSFRGWAQANPVQQGAAPPAAKGGTTSAAVPVVAGGLLALLFFL